MGNSQSRVQGIEHLHASSASYRDIVRTLQCSHTTIADAIHSDMPPSPAIKRSRRPVITPEVSGDIETLSLMDARLSNAHIKAKVEERWPDLKVGKTSIRDARSNLGFKFRPPMIKQELSPEQQFQRHQFGLDMLAKDLDPATNVFSDERCFVLGIDKRWRHIRRGQWNESCFAAEEKFPESLMIWGWAWTPKRERMAIRPTAILR
jgi:hypothetical protein